MAIFSFDMRTISRSSGRSATAALAYRAGWRVRDERTATTFDYSRRASSSVLSVSTVAPTETGEIAILDVESTQALWNSAETAEARKNAVVAREIIVALPAELDGHRATVLAMTFGRHVARRLGVGVTVALHAADRRGDRRNRHAHILLTTRRAQIAACDAITLGAKTRELDDRARGSQIIRELRERWAVESNRVLADAGHEARIDHRSLAARGIERPARRHLGPDASAMERRGVHTNLGDHNREVDAVVAERAAIEREEQQAAEAAETARRQAAHLEVLRRAAVEAQRQAAERRRAEEAAEEAERVRLAAAERAWREAAEKEKARLAAEAQRRAEAAERVRQQAAAGATIGVVEGYGVTACVTAPRHSVVLALRVERLEGGVAAARVGSFAGVAQAWAAAKAAIGSAFGHKALVSEREWKGTPEWALSAPYFPIEGLAGERAVAVVKAMLRALEMGRDLGAQIMKAASVTTEEPRQLGPVERLKTAYQPMIIIWKHAVHALYRLAIDDLRENNSLNLLQQDVDKTLSIAAQATLNAPTARDAILAIVELTKSREILTVQLQEPPPLSANMRRNAVIEFGQSRIAAVIDPSTPPQQQPHRAPPSGGRGVGD